MAGLHSHHPPEDCLNCEHRHLRMFCNLTAEALQDFDNIGIMMSHARGAKLFTEGDAARNVFVICFGQVKISSTSRDGKTMILKIAGSWRRDGVERGPGERPSRSDRRSH